MGLIINTLGSKSFKVIECINEPVIQFVPVEKYQREVMYTNLAKNNIILPDYEKIKLDKNDVRLEDLIVIHNKICIMFLYKKILYKLITLPGLVIDGTSVPTLLVHGMITKISPFSLLGSLVHDVLYALNLVDKIAADDIFEGLLKYKDSKKFIIYQHLLALRLFGFESYRRKLKYNWFPNYVIFEKMF